MRSQLGRLLKMRYFFYVPNNPRSTTTLSTINGESQSLEQWLTTFNLLCVVIDPYTYQSGWIIPTADRIFSHYREANVRCAFVVTGSGEGAKEFLGKFATDWLVLTDEKRELVASLGLQSLPALVHLGQDCSILGSAENWNPSEWHDVISGVEDAMAWRSKPLIPDASDPGPFEGTPAMG
tara:strand:- start:213 stop:752 length:540 start_codon:yes stop_codon:yes gene_type:complete